MEKLMKEILYKHPISLISVLGEACLLLSPPTGTDKEQRAQERFNSTQESYCQTFPDNSPYFITLHYI